MSRLTPVWTRRHFRTVPLLAALTIGGVAVGGEPLFVGLGVGALLIVTAAVAVGFDAFIGVVIGLFAAALLVVGKQVAGVWRPEWFGTSTAEVLSLLLVGGAAGALGAVLRPVGREPETEHSVESRAAGALDLLPRHLGELRIEEELDRAHRYDRPLAMFRIQIYPHESAALDPAMQEALVRAVARTVESLIRIIDIPYADETTSLVVVQPETTFEDGLAFVARLADAVSTASFAVRSAGSRFPVREHATIRIGIVAYPDHGDTRAALLTAATQATHLPPPVSGAGLVASAAGRPMTAEEARP